MELTAHIAFIPPGSAGLASTIPSQIPPTAGLEASNPAVSVAGQPVPKGSTTLRGTTLSVGDRSTIVVLSWYYRDTGLTRPGSAF